MDESPLASVHTLPALNTLHQQLNALADIPDSEWQWLAAQCQRFQAPRQHMLCVAGEQPQWLWFLSSGVLRFFYLTEDGKHFNKAFVRAGELAGPLVAISSGQPCSYFIETLTPVSGLRIPCQIFPQIFDRHRCWERIGRRLAELTAMRKEQRERDFLLTDAQSRYESFRQRYPGLEHEIAQKHIAAYIGVTEVALSRLLRAQRN